MLLDAICHMLYTCCMVIDGKKIAAEILSEVQMEVKKLSFTPIFCDILVGDDPASVQYVRVKAETAEKVGIKFLNANFPGSITTEELLEEIKKINLTPNLCGLIIQLPLPAQIEKTRVLNAIDPTIDVDCTGEKNSGMFYSGQGYLEFPTARAVMKVLDSTGKDFSKTKNLIIGYGQLVGRPVSSLFEKRGWPCQIARSRTENIDQLLKEADLIVSAVGRPKIITGAKIKAGSIVIDAGTSEGDFGSVVGDADFESVSAVSAMFSPVPGGVGPVTVACLLENVCRVAKTKN